MADIFNPEATSSDNPLEQLVGEGKKYKDVNELAKAYLNADTHISELRTDLTSTREFIASKLDELAKQREAQPAAPNVETGSAPTPAPVAPPKGEEEDLDTRIAKALEERDLTKRYQDNANIVQDALVERLGSVEEAAKAVIAKAAELGVDPSYMKQTAASSPRAFFNLMGIDPETRPSSSSTPAPSSDVNPQRLGDTSVKPNSYAFYEQLRKSNPSVYWSPRTQQALMKDAHSNPDFFNR